MPNEPARADDFTASAAAPAADRHVATGPGHEFDLVRMLQARWGPRARGLGDDAAMLEVPLGERLVVSTDTTVEDVHFRTAWLSIEEVGYRAATGALSDLAAMGARPLGMTVALTLPAVWVGRVGELAEGIGAAAERAGAPIVGGDLTRGEALTIALTVLGTSRRPVPRSGARPGDVVYVTGVLGGPGAALRAWHGGEEPEPFNRARFAAPAARIAEGLWLATAGTSAMIDISDSLASEARHLAAASGVTVEIDIDLVPTVAGVSAVEAALSGEEYELLLAGPASLDTEEFARRFGVPLTPVGAVTAAGASGPVARFTRSGRRVDLAPGYDHFSP